MDEKLIALIYKLIKEYEPERRDFGRPRQDDEKILRGILWVLRSGARWYDLNKDEYPPYQTCHRRFQEWINQGVFQAVLAKLAKDYHDFDMSECFIDGTFSSAKKGAAKSEKPSAEKVRKLWSSQMQMVYRSPLMWQALRLTRSRLLKKH